MSSMSLDDYAMKTLGKMYAKTSYDLMRDICADVNEQLLEGGFTDEDIKEFNHKILLLVRAKTVKATDAQYEVAEKVIQFLNMKK